MNRDKTAVLALMDASVLLAAATPFELFLLTAFAATIVQVVARFVELQQDWLHLLRGRDDAPGDSDSDSLRDV